MSDLSDLQRRLSEVANPVALLEGFFAHAPMGLQIYVPDGHCLITNQAFRDLFGAAPLPEYNLFEDPLLVRSGVLESIRRAFAGETVTMPTVWYDTREQPLRSAPGRRCAVSCTAFPLLDGAGRVAHVAMVFKDVTAELAAREQAEAERDRLAVAQARLQAFLEHVPVVLFLKDLEGHHIILSREAERAFGFRSDDALGKTAHELFGTQLSERSRQFEARALAERTPVRSLDSLPQADGPHEFLVTRFPVFGPDGQPVAVGGIAIDMTPGQKAKEELRRSEGRFSQVFRALPMAALLSRMSDRRFIDVNDAWVQLTGFPREEMVGRTSVELGLWVDVQQRDDLFRQLAERPFVRDFSATLHQKSGAQRELLLSVDRIEIAGEPCLLLLAHDLTDYRRLERELRHSQKMDAIGRLAGGIAHDFNNILTAIGGADSLLLEGLGADNPLRRYAEQIQRSTAHAASLTRQLLTFTRKRLLEPVVLDPNQVVRATVEMLQRMIGEDIELRTELAARGHVLADQGSLEQVILNLAVNARDAMPKGGLLSLRTADVRGGSGGPPDGEWVMLAIKDAGVGMDAQTRAHIFEPFFTTKEQGKGTGLGLSTVYAIVEQCGGLVVVESEPGQGSDFQVYLPRHEDLEEPTALSPRVAPILGGRETILLVEDDDGVRDFIHLVLEGLGYRVLEAASGPQALEVSRAFTEPIDLLLSDVVMPRMNGIELAQRLVRERPTIKVMHMSGYPGDAIEPTDGNSGAAPLLGKPFDRDRLARMVRSVLDASG